MHPWDSHNDISTYENNFIILTRTRYHSIIRGSICNTHDKPLQFNRKKSFDNNDNMTSLLKRFETKLTHTIERIDLHEQQIHNLLNHQRIHFPSPYIHFIMIIFVAIVLKFIFR